MHLLGFICFQTKALLCLLVLEKLRGHQRRGVRIKGWKHCCWRAWGSACRCGTGTQRYQYEWKWITILPGKSEVEMLYLHWGRCQELQFSPTQKAGKHFGTRAISGAWQTSALPIYNERISVEPLQGEGRSKRPPPRSRGSQRTCYRCCLVCGGERQPGQRAEDAAPGTKVPPWTLGELISYRSRDWCFWEDEICRSGERGFLGCSPIFYGDKDGVCISNTAWWLSLTGGAMLAS